jgi:cytochrome c556
MRGRKLSDLEESSPGPRAPAAVAIARGWLVAAFLATLLATGLVAIAQDQRSATAEDVIFARKSLMNSICEKMTSIERMIALGQIDPDAARRHADAMSVMFMAFPHLFPPSSDQWSTNSDPDPVTDTYASPELWTRFSDFYRQSAAAAKTAHDMSRADKIDDFKTSARELRIICDTCHALYSENQ